MSCLTECQELNVYDFNRNKTMTIMDCYCAGCCSTFHAFMYLLYFCVCVFTFVTFCEMANSKRKRQRMLVNNNEQLPVYTEDV